MCVIYIPRHVLTGTLPHKLSQKMICQNHTANVAFSSRCLLLSREVFKKVSGKTAVTRICLGAGSLSAALCCHFLGRGNPTSVTLNKHHTEEPLPLRSYTPSTLVQVQYFLGSPNMLLECYIMSQSCLAGEDVPSEVALGPSVGLTSLATWQLSTDARKTGLPHTSSDRT